MPRKRRRKRSLLPFLFILPAIAGTIFVLFYIVNYFGNIQSEAYQFFGPADPELSLYQKFNLSMRLNRDKKALLETNELEGDILFEISSGDNPFRIADRLFENGMVPDPDRIIDYLLYKGYDTKLLTGSFQITNPNTPIEIIHTLIDPDAIVVEVYILAGWRVEEIAENLEYSGLLDFNKEEFLSLAKSNSLNDSLPFNLPTNANLEGFLAPGTYVVKRNISEAELLDRFLQEFANNISEGLVTDLANNGLSLYEAVTMASIIEREIILDEEKPMIAAVFYNRLNSGWKLETDPTVQYAVSNSDNWWKNPLTWDDLNFDSPYNTYFYYGLPPGPISNPAISTINAVAYPAASSYYFFRAKCDGSFSHTFSVTYEEHLNAGCD